MAETPTPTELEAFLDEALPPERMAQIEQALRDGDTSLQTALAETSGRRDAGLHSLGGIWRRRRLTCPSREQLGSYLLGVLADDEADYIKFHLEEIACRPCVANLDDLRTQQSAGEETIERRQRYFQSSVGRLKEEG